ncbi:hypothetical protein ACFFLS_04345 [Flavobacterium procerum]|uniref:Lipoprotein n=1 Tax=Flavobacterium procerum TaxID=1455569 RepID=A0ABV6BLD9_9FLAO
MNKKKLLRTLLLSFIVIQLSCKKENDQNLIPSSNDKPDLVTINEGYQKNEKQNGNENLEVNSIIHFSKKYNSPQTWDYSLNLTEASLRGFHKLSNGNTMSIVENDNRSDNSTVFVLILDKEGKEIAKKKLPTNSKSKFNLYNILVKTDNAGGFTIYMKKQIRSLSESNEDSDEAKLKRKLREYQIDKIKFNNTYADPQIESKSMETVFLKSFQDKGLSKIVSADFSMKYLKDKIVVYGTTGEPSLSDTPFVAVLDQNMKLLRINSFSNYLETAIDNITLNKENNLFVEGLEHSGADGTCYRTKKRFVLDDNLKLIADKSDKEPYESFYCGPAFPESDEESSEEAESEPQEEETTVKPEKKEVWDTYTFHKDEKEEMLYNFKQKGMFSNKIILEKTKLDSTALWQIKFMFPDNYEVSYSSSLRGFKRSNGDFVFCVYLREKVNEKEKLSMAIFVFNKEGHLIRQFETPSYYGLTNFEIEEIDGNLIVAYMSYDSKYINGEWKYDYAFRANSYSLE